MFGNVPAAVNALATLESQAVRTAEAIRRLPPIPRNQEEPNRSRNVQDADYLASLTPEAQARRLRGGGDVPNIPTSAVPANVGLIGDTYSPEQLNRTGRRFDPDGGGGNAFAAQLTDFASRIERVFGADNFFVAAIRSQIPYLTSGAKSVFEVRKYLEALFIPFIAGIQNEILSPESSAEMRELDNEILRLIAGGNVGGGTPFQTLTPGQRRTPTGQQQGGARDGVAARAVGIAAAVGNGFAGLGAAITSHAEGETDKVVSAVRATVPAVRDAVKTEVVRANQGLAERFRDLHDGQRRIETGVRALGSNALSAEALRAELERLRLSGRLGVA